MGASAEDTEAELIRKICETELLAGETPSAVMPPDGSQCSLTVILTPVRACVCVCLRGGAAVCVPAPAGEGVQLPRAVLPPPAHHRCLPGSVPVHDDQVR